MDSLAEWEKNHQYDRLMGGVDAYYPKHRKYAITTTIYHQNIVAADGKNVYLTSFEKWFFARKFQKQLDKIEKKEQNDLMAKQMAQFAENS